MRQETRLRAASIAVAQERKGGQAKRSRFETSPGDDTEMRARRVPFERRRSDGARSTEDEEAKINKVCDQRRREGRYYTRVDTSEKGCGRMDPRASAGRTVAATVED